MHEIVDLLFYFFLFFAFDKTLFTRFFKNGFVSETYSKGLSSTGDPLFDHFYSFIFGVYGLD